MKATQTPNARDVLAGIGMMQSTVEGRMGTVRIAEQTKRVTSRRGRPDFTAWTVATQHIVTTIGIVSKKGAFVGIFDFLKSRWGRSKFDDLVADLKNDDRETSEAAAKELTKLETAEAAREILAHFDPNWPGDILGQLGDYALGPVLDWLRMGMQTNRKHICEWAMSILYRIGTPEAVPALMDLINYKSHYDKKLHDSDPWCHAKADALCLLGKLRPTESTVSILIGVWSSKTEESTHLQALALHGLVDTGDAAVPAMLELLTGATNEERTWSKRKHHEYGRIYCDTLEFFGRAKLTEKSYSCIEPLLAEYNRLDKKKGDGRSYILKALLQLSPDRCKPLLEDALLFPCGSFSIDSGTLYSPSIAAEHIVSTAESDSSIIEELLPGA